MLTMNVMKKAGTTGILSHNPNNFTQVGGRYTVSKQRENSGLRFTKLMGKRGWYFSV